MPPQAVASGGPPRALRVLLVEDSPDDALLLERMLRRGGFAPAIERVETAESMRSALSDDTPPDVVIADYNLPRFSGPDALQLLRSTRLDIPFIMTSGGISEETAVESMRAGAQDYVTKQNLARMIPVLERELRDVATRRSRRAAEAALRASQTRFSRLVEAMPIGLLLSDNDGALCYANAAAEELLGTLPPGVRLPEILPKWNDLLAEATLAPVAGRTRETRGLARDGKELDVLVGLTNLDSEGSGELGQTAAFLVDLSLQKKSAEILRRTEKLAVAGRLAASIAHEINNPLEAVTNCLYLVSQCDLPAEARRYLELATSELNRVAQITVQTLRFYRRSTHAAHTDVHELLENVLTLLESRLRRCQITVHREFSALDPIYVHDGEIRQVFANLIGNAIDALSSGGRLVVRTAAARHRSSGEPGIRISIADSGCGMPPDVQTHLFEPFFSTKGITGTGLGLWISREIVLKHRGTLAVRSRPHDGTGLGGTVFSIFLPSTAQEDSEPAGGDVA